MPLVNRLGLFHATIQLRNKILGKPNKGLNCQEDVSGKTKNSMGRLEVGAVVIELVYFNDNQTRNQEVKSKVVEPGV